MNTDENVPEIPQTLLASLTNKSVVLFVGSGLSRAAGAPGWKDLLSGLVARFDADYVDIPHRDAVLRLIDGSAEDLLWAAEYLKSIDSDQVYAHIREVCAELVPQTTHELIAQLPCHGVVTTNYDDLIERAYAKEKGRVDVVLPHHTESLARIEDRSPWVLKLHGSFEDLPRTVLTHSEYEELTFNSSVGSTFSRLFQRFTFLFLGCGLRDPDTLQQLGQLRLTFQGCQRTHYALFEESELNPVIARVLSSAYKVRILKYRKSSEARREISKFLTKLRNALPGAVPLRSRKLLFVIPMASSEHDGAPNLLVCPPDSGDCVQGAYWLPSLSDEQRMTKNDLLTQGLRHGMKHWKGFNASLIDLEVDDRVFRSKKFSPSHGIEIDYTFRFVYVRLDPEFVKRLGAQVRFGGHVFEWKPLTMLLSHRATKEYNEDVLKEIVLRLGQNLGLDRGHQPKPA